MSLVEFYRTQRCADVWYSLVLTTKNHMWEVGRHAQCKLVLVHTILNYSHNCWTCEECGGMCIAITSATTNDHTIKSKETKFSSMFFSLLRPSAWTKLPTHKFTWAMWRRILFPVGIQHELDIFICSRSVRPSTLFIMYYVCLFVFCSIFFLLLLVLPFLFDASLLAQLLLLSIDGTQAGQPEA